MIVKARRGRGVADRKVAISPDLISQRVVYKGSAKREKESRGARHGFEPTMLDCRIENCASMLNGT